MSFFKSLGRSTGLTKLSKKLGLEKISKGLSRVVGGHKGLNAEREARSEKANQLALLTAQQNAAANTMADLSLENTPTILPGGTADMLTTGRGRKRKAGAAGSIATSLGI